MLRLEVPESKTCRMGWAGEDLVVAVGLGLGCLTPDLQPQARTSPSDPAPLEEDFGFDSSVGYSIACPLSPTASAGGPLPRSHLSSLPNGVERCLDT